MKNYTTYKANQLLDDDDFLKAEQYPTNESTMFWNKLQEDNLSLAREIEIARNVLHVLKKESLFLPEVEVKQLWGQIENVNTRNDKNNMYRVVVRLGVVAACIAILMVGGLMMYDRNPESDILSFVTTVEPSQNKSSEVQLVISEKKVVSVGGKASTLHYDKSGQINVNSKVVDVTEESKSNKKSVYNQLIVPVGKTSSITFSDGTRVWVNSDSRLVYPVSFAKEKREIYVEGEIYLEVAHDEQKPFVVKTDRIQVKVLGTAFNVSAYKNEPKQSVVLVNGKVEVVNPAQKESHILLPNEMLLSCDGIMQVKPVEVQDHIAWKSGFYQYHKERLHEILRRLSRYYGREIQYSAEAGQLTCSGKLDLQNDITEVLNTIMATAPVLIDETENKIYVYVKPLKPVGYERSMK